MNVKLMVRRVPKGVEYYTFNSVISAEAAANAIVLSPDVMYAVVMENNKAIGGYLNDNGTIRDLIPA